MTASLLPRVLVCVLPARGHVTPTVAIVEGLVTSGHHVNVLTGRKYAERFTHVGAQVSLIAAEADFDDGDFDTSFPGRSELKGIALARHDLRESFVLPIPSRWRSVQNLLAAEPLDVVLCDPLFMAGMPLLATRSCRRPRVYILGFLPISLPPLSPPGRGHAVRELMTRMAMAAMLKPVQDLAGRVMMQLAGKKPPKPFINWIADSDGILAMCQPGLEYPRPDYQHLIHYIGPVTTSNAGDYSIPTWWDDVDKSKPIVLVTQGTVANNNLEAVIGPTLQALAGENVTVIATVAGAQLDFPIPGNAKVVDYLPYDEILPHCAAFVTNGGWGGVTLAIKHGIPVVVVGASEDKRLVAQRVNYSGAGVGIPSATASPRKVRRAILKVLDKPQYRDAAVRLADQGHHAGGVADAIRIIDGVDDGTAKGN